MKTRNNTQLATKTKATFSIILIISSLSISRVQAQAPGIVGIDHVGINVPNLDEGVKFFHDMFGFTPVTKLGPFPMDANWKNAFHIHSDADKVELIMMRAGDGSNIEVFSYQPNAGSKEQPYRDDLSAYHFALYTRDIEATKAYLESKGVKFLSGIQSGGGDTEGEKWVYLETPWGATIELNSYPNGKGYEKHNPAVKLWSVSTAVDLTTVTISKEDLASFAAKQVKVWNETDPQNRLVKMKEIYQDNVAFFDDESVVNGLSNLNDRITKLQEKLKGFKFSVVKVDNLDNVVRYFWNFGPASNPKTVSGMDLIILEDGKIRSLHVFIDPEKK